MTDSGRGPMMTDLPLGGDWLQPLRDIIERWEKATGGLPPELVAKALATCRDATGWNLAGHGISPNELRQLTAATFEVPA